MNSTSQERLCMKSVLPSEKKTPTLFGVFHFFVNTAVCISSISIFFNLEVCVCLYFSPFDQLVVIFRQ